MKTIEAIVLLLIGAALGLFAGLDVRQRLERARAIDAGVAQYVGDPKTGNSTFTYIKPAKPTEAP